VQARRVAAEVTHMGVSAVARRAGGLAAAALVVAMVQPLATGSADGGKAQAVAAPVPETRSFGAAIEPLSTYEGAQLCDPRDQRGPQALLQLLNDTYGPASFGISRACSGVSEHSEGRALDWMHDASNKREKAEADAFLKWLLAEDEHGNSYAMARRLGIMYVIWNKRMWRAYDPGRGWAPYSGYSPHTDHVHFSFSWDGAAALTSFYTGKALGASCAATPTSAAPALPRTALDYVPLAPHRVANTASGKGVAERCRLGAGGRVDVKVLGRGGVPKTGVAAVAVNVSVRSSSAPATLRAFPAGAGAPAAATVSVGQRRGSTGLTVLPVGGDGRVSLTTTRGSTDVALDVVGYYRSSGLAASLYRPLVPSRVLDTRDGAPLAGKQARKLTLGGIAGIPDSGVTAVALSVTASGSGRKGGVAVYPAGGDPSGVSAVSFPAGEAATNEVIAATSRSGKVVLHNRSKGEVNLRVDVLGWYGPASAGNGHGGAYLPVQPKQVIDTRAGKRIDGRLNAGRKETVKVTDIGRVPAHGVSAVLLQLTAQAPGNDGSLEVWPHGTHRPGVRSLSVQRGRDTTTVVVAAVDERGRVRLRSMGADYDLSGTVLGYYT